MKKSLFATCTPVFSQLPTLPLPLSATLCPLANPVSLVPLVPLVPIVPFVPSSPSFLPSPSFLSFLSSPLISSSILLYPLPSSPHPSAPYRTSTALATH